MFSKTNIISTIFGAGIIGIFLYKLLLVFIPILYLMILIVVPATLIYTLCSYIDSLIKDNIIYSTISKVLTKKHFKDEGYDQGYFQFSTFILMGLYMSYLSGALYIWSHYH